MNPYLGRNYKYLFLHKRHQGHIFLLPPEKYVEFLKNIYEQFKNSKGPKTLHELKRLAIEEAKKQKIPFNVAQGDGVILPVQDLIKLLKAVYGIVNPLLVKINHSYKNERRTNFENNEKYMDIIRSFEHQKWNLIKFTVKSLCKKMKKNFTDVQSSIFYHIEKEDVELIEAVNIFSKAGKLFALAPKNLTLDEIVEILKFYYENLKFLIIPSSVEINHSVRKNALVIINDIVYQNFGLEEEQIFAYISEKSLDTNKEVGFYLNEITRLIQEHITLLFEI